MEPNRVVRAVATFVVSALALYSAASGSPQVPAADPETPAFREFSQLVRDYVKLVRSAPHQRTTKKRGEIRERRMERAQTIRQVRPNAKPGDIFTPEVSAEFRQTIRSALQGSGGPRVRKTIREGAPLPDRYLSVNDDYPEHLPRTTVPATLLLRLPRLPAEVAYQIVGHDFVLVDKEARVVIDFIPGALPISLPKTGN